MRRLLLLFFASTLCPLLIWAQDVAIQDSVVYNPRGGLYLRYVRMTEGEAMRLRQVFTPKEYVEWRKTELNRRYALGLKVDSVALPTFLKDTLADKGKPKMKFDLIGDIMLSLGGKEVSEDNPSVPEALRKRSHVDFKQSINVRATATYGDHLKLDVGYNTETTLWGEARRLNLSYNGAPHEAIKSLEVGDISFVSANPLIKGLSPLFGIKGEVNLGGLNIKTFVAKREGASRRMTVRGGRQVRPFVLRGSSYEHSRHFFLSEFFARRYDEALRDLPVMHSELYIERVQVWVTARAHERIPRVIEQVGALASLSTSSDSPPNNEEDGLYLTLAQQDLSAWRSRMSSSREIEMMEGAKRLPEEAYKINRQLGYISLNIPLADNEALAVSYEYTYGGRRYRVGDFAENDSGSDLIVAALISTKSKEPSSLVWNLMMKNAYAIPGGGRRLRREDLKAEIVYKDFASNTERRNITEGTSAGRSWSEVFGWDKSDSQGGGTPDGQFDFLEGATVDSELGVLFLPSRRPLESVPKTVNGTDSYYPVYSRLYDATQAVAQRLTDLDIFSIRGEYSSETQTTIYLGSGDIAPGSVSLTTQGRQLQEGSDFSINYASGELTLLTSGTLSSEDIEVIIEERDRSSRKDKTLLGVEANYAFSPNLSVGATALDYRERGLHERIRWGEEPVHNRMWGVHLDYRKTSARWTEWLNTLPLLELNEPSSLCLRAAYAKFETVDNENQDVVIEDFEQNTTAYDLLDPLAWSLASPPTGTISPLDADNRALLSWYSIDPRLVREGLGNIMPEHIRQDKAMRNNPFVREIQHHELFPTGDHSPLSDSYLNTVNLSFYPKERGPYNLSTEGLDAEAYFTHPSKMWGGMMRALPVRDFEAARIEYIEGWFMDPFADGSPAQSGELFIDLGRISEDILSDGANVYESGLPSSLHPENKVYDIPLGIAPTGQGQVYAFAPSSSGEESRQDVGFNGISSDRERKHQAYADFLDKMSSYSESARWKRPNEYAPYHPKRDPAGDDYVFYLGRFWDEDKADILTRYKYINGVEGNSTSITIQGQQAARTWTPDAEDLDGDMQMDRTEDFFRYKVLINKGALKVGHNHIVSQQVVKSQTTDGATKDVTWYKIRIPLARYAERIGTNPTLRDIRGMRLFVKGFDETVHLRWAALRLVRSDWTVFDTPLDINDKLNSSVALGVLSIEEDSGRQPIPYVLPPGIERRRDRQPTGPVLRDERSLSLKIDNLEARQSVAIYKPFGHDLRHYEKLKMFAHAESPIDDPKLLQDNSLELFIRLGRDYTENYYEYRQPLKVTHFGKDGGIHLSIYDIWPSENNIDISLKELSDLKKQRDVAIGHDISIPFESHSSQHTAATISVKGHPSLGDVTAVMIGVRSVVDHTLRGEVWINELRVSGAQDKGGYALTALADLRLSDLARIEVSGTRHGLGFGAIDSNIRHLNMDDRRTFDVSAELKLDKFFPTSWKASIPVKYAHSYRRLSPKYDPIADDILFDEKASALPSADRRAYELKVSQIERHSLLSVEDIHFDIKDSVPKFWNPSHLRLAYRQEKSSGSSPQLLGSYRREAYAHLTYGFTARPKGITLLDNLHLFPYPQEWYLSSRWRRSFDHRKQRDKAIMEDSEAVSHYLYHRFDWERNLRIGWRMFEVLQLSWDSTTSALIDEPFDDDLARHNDVSFRILSDTIVHSLLHLGTTNSYNGRGSVSLHLPTFERKGLKGLSGSLTLHSIYRWDRGPLSLRNNTTGHNVRQTTTRDAFVSYHFMPWLSQLTMRLRDTWGSHLPGFRPEAGDFFGISVSRGKVAPGIGYMFGMGNDERHIRHIIDASWVISDQNRQRPLSWYHNADFESEITVEPLSGLRLSILLARTHHQRSELLPSQPDDRPRQTGLISYSTIGLKGFSGKPLREKGYYSVIFRKYQEAILDHQKRLQGEYSAAPSPHAPTLSGLITPTHTDILAGAFIDTYTSSLSHRGKGILPSFASLMPNWDIRLDLTALFPGIKKKLPKLSLRHHYRGRMEINSYQVRSGWHSLSADDHLGYSQEGNSTLRPGGLFEALSITQRDELSPLFGFEIGLKHGLSIDLRYNKIRELSLLLQSARLLENYRNEILSTLRYRTSIPSLLQVFKKEKVDKSLLTLQYSVTLGHNYVLSRDLARDISQSTQGMHTLTSRIAIDYAITKNIAVRGFYDMDKRTPLVSVRTYPYESHAYGIMLRLNLHP
ncbi:cell surface protein SprA [Porphyromonas sp.]|uniref:T9SS outer membrane translocon Sov/SprA n=1 Tax=Porphyromonas sp. TaxID=1924944 RepID=UPI0026DC5B05|nr:cell surface protein SprA [Porphyromonas sp.]MDO4770899.1 cell surface protein SprA [Porphyromonas sp.]